MTRTPILALPNFQEQFTMETDACKDGIAAVLMQKDQPIAYLSKAPGDNHKNLSIYEKEFLALIMAVEKWRHYLQRQEFIVLTDKKSLAYLNEQNLHSEMQRKAITRMQRKAMTRFMGLQFKIVYKKGKDNIAAVALSRVAHLLAIQSVSTTSLGSRGAEHLCNRPTSTSISSPNSLENGLTRYKGNVWIGHHSTLQTKLIVACHSSALGVTLEPRPHIIDSKSTLIGRA